MSARRTKKSKSQLYSHIASAIIPIASIVAVPSAYPHFPQQKVRGSEEWGPLASTLLRASFTNQMLIPSSSTNSLSQPEENEGQSSRKGTSIGRMDASTDEDDSDDETEERKYRDSLHASTVRSSISRPASLSNAEKRLFKHLSQEDEQSSTTAEQDANTTARSSQKQTLNADPTRSSTTTTTTDDKSLKKASVTIVRQFVPPVVLNPTPSPVGPSSARPNSQLDGDEARSTMTARSSLNDTTIPVSARSVSFKEPVIYEAYDPPSSKSQPTTTVIPTNNYSVLDKIVIPPPEEYQQNFNELEKRNKSLTDEVQQLRLINQNLQKQQDELYSRLQKSQKLSERELNDLLKQAGHNQTKELENLNQTLQNRCDRLQNELTAMRERHSQDQGQSSARELKSENSFLKEYNHRLNAELSEYQATHPPDIFKKDKEQRNLKGLPMKGPSPIWLLDQKFLSPLFVCYDEKLHEREDFIKKLQSQLNDLHDQFKLITNENLSLYERIARTSTTSPTHQGFSNQAEVDNIKRQAYLVLEENKVLQEQLHLQNNQLTDLQKTQIQEMSNLTKRLMIIESEKTEADRIVETMRKKNDELRKKYDQSIIDNDHRIRVEEHVREIGEMKRITEDLSEKHAIELQLLLRRVQDAEMAKKDAQLKLSEFRNEMERLRSDTHATKKMNRKLQLRVQNFEKKLELQQIKEQRTEAMLEKANGDIERMKLEQESHSILAKAKEDEMHQTKERMKEEINKIVELETRLEACKNKNKEYSSEVQEQIKKQYENLKLRCSEHEERIQKLIALVNEKEVIIDSLNSEKRNLEVDLETMWQTTIADNKRMRQQLLEMHAAI